MDVLQLKVRHEEKGRSIGTGMERSSLASQDYFRGFDVTHEVLQPFKKDVSQAVLHEFIGFDGRRGGNDWDVAVEGSKIKLP